MASELNHQVKTNPTSARATCLLTQLQKHLGGNDAQVFCVLIPKCISQPIEELCNLYTIHAATLHTAFGAGSGLMSYSSNLDLKSRKNKSFHILESRIQTNVKLTVV